MAAIQDTKESNEQRPVLLFRQVKQIFAGQPVLEGAGVRLRRLLGLPRLEYLDPFLLLDEFKSENADDYIAGFPWHPHRGMETVTYMLEGVVKHEDSLGNAGTIGPGDVQWMTAGSGIIHSEMPQQQKGLLWGFQLWVNLPASEKMCEPRYQEFDARQVPQIRQDNGATVRVIAGEVDGVKGPVTDIVTRPLYLDILLPAHRSFRQSLEKNHTVFAYVYHGQGECGRTEQEAGTIIKSPNIVVFGEGDTVQFHTTEDALRFLLIAGKPLHEPVARGGPFVMNTPAEIQQAFAEYQAGTFVKIRN